MASAVARTLVRSWVSRFGCQQWCGVGFVLLFVANGSQSVPRIRKGFAIERASATKPLDGGVEVRTTV